MKIDPIDLLQAQDVLASPEIYHFPSPGDMFLVGNKVVVTKAMEKVGRLCARCMFSSWKEGCESPVNLLCCSVVYFMEVGDD